MDQQGQEFLKLAEHTANCEARRAKPLFALLTGSVAWGTTSSRSDIDIIFVTSDHDFVSYRYYMPELTGVAIRTEVGRIPLAYLEKVLGSGYADDITTGIREQIRNAKVLSGDQALAERTIARFASLKPKKRLLGEYLFHAREAAAEISQSLGGARLLGAMLAMDLLAKNIWRLMLVARHEVGVQKDKHEIKAARSQLGADDLARYETSRRVAGTTQAAARAALAASQKVVARVLDLAGVDVSIVGDVDA